VCSSTRRTRPGPGRPRVECLRRAPVGAVQSELLEHRSALVVREAHDISALDAQQVEGDERQRRRFTLHEHALAQLREVGLAVCVGGDELAVEHGTDGQLGEEADAPRSCPSRGGCVLAARPRSTRSPGTRPTSPRTGSRRSPAAGRSGRASAQASPPSGTSTACRSPPPGSPMAPFGSSSGPACETIGLRPHQGGEEERVT